MNSRPTQEAVDQAAALWDVRLRSHGCSQEDRECFDRWLQADARHRAAYERLQLLLATLRAGDEHARIRALRERASLAEQRVRARGRVIRWAAAAAVAAIVLNLGVVFLPGPREAQPQAQQGALCASSAASQAVLECEMLVTAPGERRTVSLQDGTSVTLKGSTRLEMVWSPDRRTIRIVSGRALFRVAKDAARPFVVMAGDRSVTALGTTFDVRVDARKVEVTLLEGRVAVRGLGDAAREPALELEPDQRLTAFNGQAVVRRVDSVQESAWAEGKLYFADEPLSSAVAEINQHSVTQILIADAALNAYRVSGMFRAGNQAGFVSAVTAYFPIDACRDDAGHIVLRARSEAGCT